MHGSMALSRYSASAKHRPWKFEPRSTFLFPGLDRICSAENLIYKNRYSPFRRHSETGCICLNRLIGARGFEPPTPWSRIRFRNELKSLECDGLYLVAMEPVAGCSLEAIEPD